MAALNRSWADETAARVWRTSAVQLFQLAQGARLPAAHPAPVTTHIGPGWQTSAVQLFRLAQCMRLPAAHLAHMADPAGPICPFSHEFRALRALTTSASNNVGLSSQQTQCSVAGMTANLSECMQARHTRESDELSAYTSIVSRLLLPPYCTAHQALSYGCPSMSLRKRDFVC